jgi:hypothetical protein
MSGLVAVDESRSREILGVNYLLVAAWVVRVHDICYYRNIKEEVREDLYIMQASRAAHKEDVWHQPACSR